MSLSRNALAIPALAADGGERRSRGAGTRGVATRTAQHRAGDRIAKPGTAFLRSRRLDSILPDRPCSDDPFGPAPAQLLDAALAAGRTEAEARRNMAAWTACAGRRAAA